MKTLISSAILFIISISLRLVSAQDSLPIDSTDQQAKLPYEITVNPFFKKGDIRNLIIQVEEDFIRRFNELNADDDYDVICNKQTATMSHIARRTCEPNFLISERAENASEAAFDLSRVRNEADLYQIYVMTPRALRKKVSREYATLQSKLEEFIRSDEELKTISIKLNELNSRLKDFGKE